VTFPRAALLLLPALLVLAAPALRAESGPTPYPAAENEAAWPGHGPIRLFKWMPENRARFWLDRGKDQRAIVFTGDSLTANWKDLADQFPGLKVANRGIGGDTSRGLLFRFKEDVLDLRPRAIVLCIGTNDLSAHAAPADVEGNIATLIALARAQDPQVPIVLATLPPRDNPQYPTQPGAHDDVNIRITNLAAQYERIVVLDLYKGLATADGKPVPEYFGQDRIHVAASGYHRWTELLRPVFEQLDLR
jgi:lysophospholipase L1-like esterase